MSVRNKADYSILAIVLFWQRPDKIHFSSEFPYIVAGDQRMHFEQMNNPVAFMRRQQRKCIMIPLCWLAFCKIHCIASFASSISIFPTFSMKALKFIPRCCPFTLLVLLIFLPHSVFHSFYFHVLQLWPYHPTKVPWVFTQSG